MLHLRFRKQKVELEITYVDSINEKNGQFCSYAIAGGASQF